MSDSEVLVVYNSKFQNGVWFLAYLLVALGVAYIFLVNSTENTLLRFIMGVLFVGFLGYSAATHMRAVFDSGPQIIIDDQGIYYADWRREKIDWEKIEGIRLQGARRLSTKIEIVVTRPEQSDQAQDVRFESLVLNLANMDHNAHDVWQHIRTLKPARRAIRRGLLLPS